MKILSKCDVCKQNKLFVRKRVYNIKIVGKMTSKSEMCNKCFKGIKETIKDQLV